MKIQEPSASATAGQEPGTPRVMQRNSSPRPRYGIAAMPRGKDVLYVQDVISGMPAEKCGLLKGDEILSLNGTKLAELSEEQRIAALSQSPVILEV
ncbi:MAG: PDZ domain-containing protein, partial [Phycisphaerae bacterium]